MRTVCRSPARPTGAGSGPAAGSVGQGWGEAAGDAAGLASAGRRATSSRRRIHQIRSSRTAMTGTNGRIAPATADTQRPNDVAAAHPFSRPPRKPVFAGAGGGGGTTATAGLSVTAVTVTVIVDSAT